MPWPVDWEARFSGEGCGLCAEGRPENPPRGPRIFEGVYSDAYLRSSGVQRGWAVVIWRGRHVVEPFGLSEEEAAGFWREVRLVGKAMQAHYRPLKMNHQFLGNRDRTSTRSSPPALRMTCFLAIRSRR